MQRLSEELETKAYEMALNGESFTDIAEAVGFKNSGQLARYRKQYLEFEEKMQEAVISYCEELEDKLLRIPHLGYDKDTARLLSANIIKVLEFRHPKRYSPRQNLDVNFNIDISGALDRASKRLIDVTSNVVPLLTKK